MKKYDGNFKRFNKVYFLKISLFFSIYMLFSLLVRLHNVTCERTNCYMCLHFFLKEKNCDRDTVGH